MRTIFIDEKKLDHLYIGKDFEIPSFPIEINSVEVAARAGAVYQGRKTGTLDIDIPITYQNVHNISSKEVNDLIVGFFNYDEEVSIQIEDEDWYWLGYVTGEFKVPLEKQRFYTFNLKIKLLNPFKYSIEDYTNTAFKDQVSINNTGSVELFPVITAKAKKDATHIMVSKNDDDYIMLGEAPTTEKKAKKVNPSVLSDKLESTTGWYYIGNNGSTFGDNETGGFLGGKIKSNDYGFYVDRDSYPTTLDAWVGAGVKKAYSRNVQDFEHKFTVKVKDISDTIQKFGTGKVFTHLWDETGRLVASIGLVDASMSSNDLTVIAKLYDVAGEPDTIFKYKPTKDKYLDDFVHMSIKRVGNKWTFTTNTIQEVKMVTRKDKAKYGATREFVRNLHTETYTDKYKQYMTPIRAASIYIARYNWKLTQNSSSNIEKFFSAMAYGIYTNEIQPKTPKDVDELIEKGDKIVIDNFNQKMTINKGDATKYKDFGSNYFGLEKGIHELFIYPEGTFDVTVRWQLVDY